MTYRRTLDPGRTRAGRVDGESETRRIADRRAAICVVATQSPEEFGYSVCTALVRYDSFRCRISFVFTINTRTQNYVIVAVHVMFQTAWNNFFLLATIC